MIPPLFVVAVLASFFSSLSWAYIPPSEFILNNWTNKHVVNSRAVKLKNIVTAYDQNKLTELHFKETVIYYPATGSLTSLITDDADQKLYSTEKTIESLPPITKVLLSGDLPKVTESLVKVGIPIKSKEELLALPTEAERILAESELLTRVNGQLTSLAWVISTPKPDDTGPVPQIWFEKDTFFPLKLSYLENRDQTFYEFQIEDFRSFRDFIFPKTYRVKKGDNVLFASQLQDLWIAAPDTLGVKAFHSQNSENGFSDLGQASPASLKEFILRYYGITR